MRALRGQAWAIAGVGLLSLALVVLPEPDRVSAFTSVIAALVLLAWRRRISLTKRATTGNAPSR